MNYVVSLLMGVGVGLAYALVRVDAPAPPVAALVGLLGILIGQAGGTRITRHLSQRAAARAHAAQPRQTQPPVRGAPGVARSSAEHHA